MASLSAGPYKKKLGPRNMLCIHQKVPGGGLGKFDGTIRLGTIRSTMATNHAIVVPQMEAGIQTPAAAPLPLKDFSYGIVKIKGKYDTTAAAINEWQVFDMDQRLGMYSGKERMRDCMTANKRALDKKFTDAKPWNRFCMVQKDLFYEALVNSREAFLKNRTFRVPEKIERLPASPDQMNRILSNDYGREWFRNQFSQARHDLIASQIDDRMLGVKQSSLRAAYMAEGQVNLRKRDAGRRHVERPLTGITQLMKLRNTKAKLATFREGDSRKKGWSLRQFDHGQWQRVLPKDHRLRTPPHQLNGNPL